MVLIFKTVRLRDGVKPLEDLIQLVDEFRGGQGSGDPGEAHKIGENVANRSGGDDPALRLSSSAISRAARSTAGHRNDDARVERPASNTRPPREERADQQCRRGLSTI